MSVEKQPSGKETIVIDENYYYFITIYNAIHTVLSFYNVLNSVHFNYNLYI
jgi:hypothetical protein